MKTLYFDCNMGAAGDMITAALIGLFDNPDEVVSELNSMGIPTVEFVKETVERSGIVGTHMSVRINGEEEPDDWEVLGTELGHDYEHHHHYDRDHHHGYKHSHVHDHDHSHDHDYDHNHIHNDHGHNHVHNDHGHYHVHRGMAEIESIIEKLNVSDDVKHNAITIYNLIADAESKAHGHPVSDVHFHEVGRMDAIADVVAACYLLEKLSPEKIIASPIAVGNGYVKCAHGIMVKK